MTVDKYVPIVRKGLSESTARSWSTYLDAIAEEFAGRSFDSVLTPEIEGLRNRIIADAQRRSVSRNGASAGEGVVAAARKVWKSAMDSGLATHNPATGAKKPKRTHARDRRAMSESEIEALWDAIATRTQDPTLGLLVLRLALETGMRRGEMLGLRYESLERASGCVHVGTGAKGFSTRQQPITVALWNALDAFAKERSVGPVSKATPLLLNRRGQPITRRWFEGVAARVRDAEPRFGPDGELWFTWHLTRHTAGKMVERVGGYSVAQKFLGHESTSLSGTTVLYTKATLDEVRRAVGAVWGEPMAGI